MKFNSGRLLCAMIVGAPSLAFAGQPPIGISWSPVASVPALGAYGAYLLIALMALAALRVFKQKPGLLRGVALLSASTLMASATLYVDQVVSGPSSSFTASTCEIGSGDYPFQESTAQFANESQCPMLLSLDITNQPSFCTWLTPDLVNGGVVQPGQTGILPHWSCL